VKISEKCLLESNGSICRLSGNLIPTDFVAHSLTHILLISVQSVATMPTKAAVLLALSGCMFGQFTRGFLLVTKNTWTKSTLVCRMSSAFEIEQKLALTVDDLSTLKDRLQDVGLEPAAALEMVDWYFDDISEYTLIRQDCWLRYRERKDNGQGQWELKRGRKQSNDKAATVYQEIEGLAGVRAACSLLSETNPPEPSSTTMYDFEGHSIPELPPVENAYRLQPFARIVTSCSK